MPNEPVNEISVEWDDDSQSYFWFDENVFPNGTAQIGIKLDASVIHSVMYATNQRLPTWASVDDYNLISVEVIGPTHSGSRLDNSQDPNEGQVWAITGLASGLNDIRFRVSTPSKSKIENPLLPITEDTFAVDFSVVVIVQEQTASPHFEKETFEWAASATSTIIDSALDTQLASIKHLPSASHPGKSIGEALLLIREVRFVGEQQVRESIALWGITKEAIEAQFGIPISESNWPQLSSEIQDRCEYYANDQLATSCESARENYPDEDFSEPEELSGPVIITSFMPVYDSTPSYFGITREYMQGEHGTLNDEQWDSAKSDILNEIGRYLYRDLPEIVLNFESVSEFQDPIDIRLL